ncbi:hypothetical protein ACFWCA_17540 [Streptomyces phaeochromogenes]|uniref:hypothetical protein n=1 Tax=Streptomyces phaeochromogenes TaxID=1923 RepID=UPI0036BAD462
MTDGPSETVSDGAAPHADVFVPPRAVSGAESPVVDLLTGLGWDVSVKSWPALRAGDQLSWLFLVALPVQAFLGGMGAKLADDAYRRLKALVGRTAQPAANGAPVVLQDTATGVRILLGPELDEEAYRGLRALDLTRSRNDTLRYDVTEARWVSVPDGSEGTGA